MADSISNKANELRQGRVSALYNGPIDLADQYRTALLCMNRIFDEKALPRKIVGLYVEDLLLEDVITRVDYIVDPFVASYDRDGRDLLFKDADKGIVGLHADHIKPIFDEILKYMTSYPTKPDFLTCCRRKIFLISDAASDNRKQIVDLATDALVETAGTNTMPAQVADILLYVMGTLLEFSNGESDSDATGFDATRNLFSGYLIEWKSLVVDRFLDAGLAPLLLNLPDFPATGSREHLLGFVTYNLTNRPGSRHHADQLPAFDAELLRYNAQLPIPPDDDNEDEEWQ